MVTNEKNELIPTTTVIRWHMCMDYCKIYKATQKYHLLLPFIDQMLNRLANHPSYCFLDEYSSYNQIAITPEDQEKTTFTFPYETFVFRRMPFELCNASATFQKCMLAIFTNMVEKFIEVFMDDFLVYGVFFDNYLHNLVLVLKRCVEKNLIFNYILWYKTEFFLAIASLQRGLKMSM